MGALMRENVTNGMSMLQPLLHAYDLPPDNDEVEEEEQGVVGEEVPLELSSRHPERILLLDTFYLCIWYGRRVAKWRNGKIYEQEDYAWFKEMLLAPKQECINRMSVRFPCPNLIECDENSGQQRFLIAKLNLDNSKAERWSEEEQSEGDVISDDVTLAFFMHHLKRNVVQKDPNEDK